MTGRIPQDQELPFDTPATGAREGLRLEISDADLVYWPALFARAEADRLLAALIEEIAWEQHRVRLFGREHDCPRLSAWYGDADARYRYSGLDLVPLPWTESLLAVRARVEETAGVRFNSVLANFYRDGADSMGLHADDERELGPRPVIASVSFGAARRFRLRRKAGARREELDPGGRRREIDRGAQVRAAGRGADHGIELAHGSLLVMSGDTQRYWKHALPKTRRPIGPRVNLTFRRIAPRR